MIGAVPNIPDSDYNHVFQTLYQGGAQPSGLDLSGIFDLVVLCAREFQPRARLRVYGDTPVFHAPLDDAGWRELDSSEVEIIMGAADEVSWRLQHDQTILVTCAAGLNRSGVVSAIALKKAYGLSPATAIAAVRAARGEFALHNKQFVKLIENS